MEGLRHTTFRYQMAAVDVDFQSTISLEGCSTLSWHPRDPVSTQLWRVLRLARHYFLDPQGSAWNVSRETTSGR